MTIYRCPKICPINKKCFILKSKADIPVPITVLVKCASEKGKDIEVEIGKTKPP